MARLADFERHAHTVADLVESREGTGYSRR